MKHILFILDYYPPHYGGAENVYQHIIEGLLTDGYKISLITTHFSPKLKKKEQHPKYKHFTIYRTGSNRKNFIFNAMLTGRKILKKYHNKKDEKIDFIHTATYGGAIPARILSMFFKKKIILTVHEVFGKLWDIYKGYRGSLPYQRFEKVLFSLSFDIYHCVSLYTMNTLRTLYGISDKKLHMIYNGLDNDFRDPNTIDKNKLVDFQKKYGISLERNMLSKKLIGLYYGHAGKSKGLDFLITSIVPILQQNNNIQFIFNIIPSKTSNASIQKLKNIRKKHKQDKRLFVFTGFSLEELKLLVASCDFVVAPSLAEGFGSVHSEVSQMGKILITTPIAAIPEVVYGKIKFIPPGDSLKITEAIGEIQKQHYDIIPKKKFDWKNTIKKLQQIYSSLDSNEF